MKTLALLLALAGAASAADAPRPFISRGWSTALFESNRAGAAARATAQAIEGCLRVPGYEFAGYQGGLVERIRPGLFSDRLASAAVCVPKGEVSAQGPRWVLHARRPSKEPAPCWGADLLDSRPLFDDTVAELCRVPR